MKRSLMRWSAILYCALSMLLNQALASPPESVDFLLKKELAKYSKEYILEDSSQNGNTRTYTYIRYRTACEGNTCSVYFEVQKKDTLTIQINPEKNTVTSEVESEEISREAINGLK